MSFTGGTGDILPQVMTLSSGVAGDVDDYVVAQLALPVPRIGTSTDRATIFEILWVDWYIGIEDNGDVTGTQFAHLSTTNLGRASADTTSLAALVADIANPRSFASVVQSNVTTTSGSFVKTLPQHVDLTDNNGNGILIATDKIFVIGGNISGTAASTYVAKAGYRLVNVGTMEYVGVVQSQMS